jgi:hypothetical protein
MKVQKAIGLLALLARCFPGQRADGHSTGSARIERETRRVRAGAPAAPQAPAANSVRNTPIGGLAVIGKAARAAARDDFQRVGRTRANPYERHSASFARWALDYASQWEELAQSSPGLGRDPQARPHI